MAVKLGLAPDSFKSTYTASEVANADPAEVQLLTRRLVDLAHSLPRDPSAVLPSGAAGGLAGGLWSALGADLRSGAEFVLAHSDFDAAARTAAAVIVGEGRLDHQTRSGNASRRTRRMTERTPRSR